MTAPHRVRPNPPFDDRHRSSWRGPNGRRCCRWCGVEVPKGRQSWCSAGCVDAYADTDFSVVSARVAKRDNGVCAKCRLDTYALRARVRAAMHEALRKLRPSASEYEVGFHFTMEPLREARASIPEASRFPQDPRRIWWEADHVVPLIEGGAHGIENIRTLCVPCHKDETRALAARLAAARRTAKLGEKRARWEASA